MTIFDWLLIGHLVGDWLLQSDGMANGKRQGLITKAGMSHFTIYTLSLLMLIWLSGYYALIQYITAGLIIFISHWLIDATNLIDGWMRIVGQRNHPLVRTMADQSMHVIILAGVAHILL